MDDDPEELAEDGEYAIALLLMAGWIFWLNAWVAYS